MPISPIVLQRRHAELGRIRLGDKRPTSTGKTRPNKLSAFRFTSASERFIRDLAALYGGEARGWDNNGKPEFEVYTQATSIPVIAVKGGLSQWMETWSGGGCVHRCDGERDVEGNYCNPDDPNHAAAKPTTRLSLMLPELEAIGVWRMETHGWNAAAEIPAVAELAQYVGDLVPAHLHLVERRTIKDGQTSRFVVPVLDLQIGTERLKQIVAEKSGQALALESGQAPAIEAPKQKRPDYLLLARTAGTVDGVRNTWKAAKFNGHLTPELDQQLQDLAKQLAPAPQQQAKSEPAVNEDGTYDAEIVEPAGQDPEAAAAEADLVWNQILKAGGERGMSLDDCTNGYAAFSGGLLASDASAAELQQYLDHLKAEAVSV